jgi:hypothetical protein
MSCNRAESFLVGVGTGGMVVAVRRMVRMVGTMVGSYMFQLVVV